MPSPGEFYGLEAYGKAICTCVDKLSYSFFLLEIHLYFKKGYFFFPFPLFPSPIKMVDKPQLLPIPLSYTSLGSPVYMCMSLM